MKGLLRSALVLFFALTLLVGAMYPLAVTSTAQAIFPAQANGSLIAQNGKVVGSKLIGQPVNDPRYFWGRPSATTPAYNAAASSGSNLGPSNSMLLEAIQKRIEALHNADPGNTSPIPADLVTASGSGLDPDISVAAALYQVPRIARLRGLDATRLRELVAEYTEGRQFGFLGEPRVNVLLLNLALDRLQ